MGMISLAGVETLFRVATAHLFNEFCPIGCSRVTSAAVRLVKLVRDERERVPPDVVIATLWSIGLSIVLGFDIANRCHRLGRQPPSWVRELRMRRKMNPGPDSVSPEFDRTPRCKSVACRGLLRGHGVAHSVTAMMVTNNFAAECSRMRSRNPSRLSPIGRWDIAFGMQANDQREEIAGCHRTHDCCDRVDASVERTFKCRHAWTRAGLKKKTEPFLIG